MVFLYNPYWPKIKCIDAGVDIPVLMNTDQCVKFDNGKLGSFKKLGKGSSIPNKPASDN